MCSPDINKDTAIEVQKPKSSVTIEEALICTKFGKFNYFIIIVSGVILSTVLLETLGISFVITYATCDLFLSSQQKGALSAIAFAGIISSSHLWGFLADTKGRRKIIYPSLFITAICSFISSFSTNFYMMVILRYICGFFVSAGSATIYAYLGEFHEVRTRSRAVMGASVVFGLGCMSLPLIAWLIINQEWQFFIPLLNISYKPWRLFLVVCSLPSILCAIALYKLPESPKYKFAKGHHNITVGILQKVYAANTGNDPLSYPVTSIVDENEMFKKKNVESENESNKSVTKLLRRIIDQTVPLFKPPYLHRTVIACLLQFGIFITSNGMYMIFPDILNRIAEYSERFPNSTTTTTLCQVVEYTTFDVGALKNATTTIEQCNVKLDFSTFKNSLILEVLYAVGFGIIGGVINLVGKLPILLFIFVGCGIIGIVAAQAPINIAVVLYVILLGCGLNIAVVNAATVDLYPTHLRAMAVCLALCAGRLGSVVGSFLVGIFIESSCNATFIGSGTSLIACGFLSFFIPNIMERVGKKSKSIKQNKNSIQNTT